jgi:hypothetical protein
MKVNFATISFHYEARGRLVLCGISLYEAEKIIDIHPSKHGAVFATLNSLVNKSKRNHCRNLQPTVKVFRVISSLFLHFRNLAIFVARCAAYISFSSFSQME